MWACTPSSHLAPLPPGIVGCTELPAESERIKALCLRLHPCTCQTLETGAVKELCDLNSVMFLM
ncbi:hypothetical protein JZ751_019441 [Albula glossodonta]|uniref:Uncharacterized protein n=1 Tax=Albula glossodonta TaxID=121402 RepID=A0A8T2NY64_9TELE|nr:hypothetical protein JZ751_019441 [Albula glossodonta]